MVLPPLIYAAGEELSWHELKRVWKPVTLLAVGLVVVSAAAVGFVTVLLTPLPLALGFVLGAVLASTDPVAVTALGRKLSLPPRLQTLVQAESLFNDATSLVLFRIAIAAALAGGVAGRTGVAGDFALLAVGGAAIRAVVAAGVALVRRRTEDPVLESVIALVTPYLAYVLAEIAHSSGVTAVVVAAALPRSAHGGGHGRHRDLPAGAGVHAGAAGAPFRPGGLAARLARRVRTRAPQAGRAGRDVPGRAADLEAASPTVLERVRHSLHIRMELEQERDDDPGDAGDVYSRIRRDVLAVQSDALARMYADGEIGERTRRRLQRHLDREDLRFTDD